MNARHHRIPGMAAAVGLVLLAWGTVQSTGAPTVPRPPRALTGPPPLARGPVPDLNLVFTAQVAGWLEPCG